LDEPKRDAGDEGANVGLAGGFHPKRDGGTSWGLDESVEDSIKGFVWRRCSMSKTVPQPGILFVLLNCPKEPEAGPFTGGEVGCPNLKSVAGSGSLGLGLDERNRAFKLGETLGSGSSNGVRLAEPLGAAKALKLSEDSDEDIFIDIELQRFGIII
jgi:hypothetical protein